MSNTEYRAVIKFFTWKWLSATEITKKLSDVYGHFAPSYHTVAKWIAELKDATRDFEDVPQSSRPIIVLTDESILAVEETMIDRFLSDT